MLVTKLKLGDVAIEYKETCKGSKAGYPIVGLEHLVPEEVTLTQWDGEKENSFTKMFRKGHVLFGRRRAYLKKAVVAPFDGICSGDIIVIEAIPEKIIPELLPFIIQNDNLFSFAVDKSAGSLSPRVKWTHLQNYEFNLPEIDLQKKLAEILWAVEEEKQKTLEAINKGRTFLRSYADDLANNMTSKRIFLSECCSYLRGLTYSRKEEAVYPTEYKVLRANNIDRNSFGLVLEDIKYIKNVKNEKL